MGKTVRGIIALALVALVIPACAKDRDVEPVTPTQPAPPPGQNRAPEVRLTSPTANTVVQNGTAVDLEANATDPDGGVTSVSFFEGSTLLETVMSPPFRFTWIPVVDGTASLTAVATDTSGASTSSAPVPVVVQTGGTTPPTTNRPPVVRITNPADGSIFTEGTPITLSADATDPDGPSLVVQFFDGGTLIGSASLIPFVVSWSGATPGSHSIRAVATDGLGASTTSDPVTIVVTPRTTTTSTKGDR